MDDRYGMIRKLSLTDAPASGGTLTVYDTTANIGTGSGKGARAAGMRYKMIVFSIYSSHVSDATTGYTVDESWDGGTNWDNLQTTAVIAATTYTKVYTKVSAPDFRCQYKNSANVLTTFRGGLVGDESERGNG
jgi:hypothetical protein